MGPIRARVKGCVDVAGLDVTFEKGEVVTSLAEEVTPEALDFLLSEKGSWEDISKAVEEEKKRVEARTKAIEVAKGKVEAAKAAKETKEPKGKKVQP